MLQEFEWELMPVMVRVEKFKNLQNKACLPSLLCYLLCPGYFGVTQREKVRKPPEEKEGKLYFANP